MKPVSNLLLICILEILVFRRSSIGGIYENYQACSKVDSATEKAIQEWFNAILRGYGQSE